MSHTVGPYPAIGDMFFLSCVHIAHLSDPHLPLVGLPSFKEIRFKRILSLLSWQLRRRHLHKLPALQAIMQDIRHFHPDMVALTGDLTNLGLLKEFQNARQWLLQQDLPPTLLIPGNHDALIKENSAAKQALWAEWLHNHTQPEPAAPSLLVKDHVALIGMNTAIPTLPFLASGKAGQGKPSLRFWRICCAAPALWDYAELCYSITLRRKVLSAAVKGWMTFRRFKMYCVQKVLNLCFTGILIVRKSPPFRAQLFWLSAAPLLPTLQMNRKKVRGGTLFPCTNNPISGTSPFSTAA